jgi:SAM-dependent methyltransferase
MTMPEVDRVFAGSIPLLYEQQMVPLIFESYAADITARVELRRPASVLEIAAGTGVVTRCLARALAPEVVIVATDLNRGMLDLAASVGTSRPVEWRTADATDLPFPDGIFDVVVCQFGAMFFPDRPRAFSEARRVLRPGGVFLFNVWDAIEHNEFAHAVTLAMEEVFPANPPRFLARVPHGYSDPELIARDLSAGGFTRAPEMTVLAARSRARHASIPAIAYCQGTPLRNEVEARAGARLVEATEAAEAAIRRRFGNHEVDGGIQARIVSVER